MSAAFRKLPLALGDLRRIAERLLEASGDAPPADRIASELAPLLPGCLVGISILGGERACTDVQSPEGVSLQEIDAFRRRIDELLSTVSAVGTHADDRSAGVPVTDADPICFPLVWGNRVHGLLAAQPLDAAQRADVEGLLYAAAECLAPALAGRDLVRRLGYRDPLTNLYNRRWLDEELTRALAQARRHGRETSLLLMDLDGFKQVNERLGHAAGDRALCAVADRLAAAVRCGDAVCRYGGDEFVVLLPETGPEGAIAAGARCAGAVAASPVPLPKGASLDVRLSFGAASSGTGPATRTAGDLLERADRALSLSRAGRAQ